MPNPYTSLPPQAFWRTAIADRSLFELGPIWDPKFDIKPTDKVITFGSCFAQYIGSALRERGYAWHRTEPPPAILSAENVRRFNYDTYSCRTGNIYTTSLLAQWTDWALGEAEPPDEVWVRDGRYFDPFRPTIEPNGFISAEELVATRRKTIDCFKRAITTARIFVFTLGLTESWKNKAGGHEYPMCPGTIEGRFDPEQHVFDNQLFGAVLNKLVTTLRKILALNPRLRIILTVSPVPLTATNSGNHVMVATMESKAVLRAVAGQLARNMPRVDYFPSYELITSQMTRGIFFEPNQRSVTPAGVHFVMEQLFACLYRKYGEPPTRAESAAADHAMRKDSAQSEAARIACEEELLEAFA